MNILKDLPDEDKLLEIANGAEVHEVNGHIHSPYSFSAFENLQQAFELAKEEDVEILGINDFYVVDGYGEFYSNALKYGVFPLFNIEFIGLLESEQKAGVRINDPNNPGRIYFSGKGLDFPFKIGDVSRGKMEGVIKESQRQVNEMVLRLNDLLRQKDINIQLDYTTIKQRYAKELVRERHIAKALRIAIQEKYNEPADQQQAFKIIFDGKEVKSALDNKASLENEIRGNLLKAGGAAFVPEDPKAFLMLDEIIDIITDAGGIPCYPVLLDDAKGNFTEYEGDFKKLYDELTARNIFCLELIPGRNTLQHLKSFVNYFSSRDFVITFGTEHNSPALTPLKIKTGDAELDDELKKVNYEGACVIAAHQYLKSRGDMGYIDPENKPRVKEKNYFIELGKGILEYYFKMQNQ
jgi:hypothetical protein